MLIVSCLRTRIIIYNQDLVAGLLWKVELLYPTLQPLQSVVVIEQANVRMEAHVSDVVPVGGKGACPKRGAYLRCHLQLSSRNQMASYNHHHPPAGNPPVNFT